MKQPSRYIVALMVVLLALACIGFVVFAGLRSRAYQAPQRPAASQQSIQKQLAAGLAARKKQLAQAAAPQSQPNPTTPAAPAPHHAAKPPQPAPAQTKPTGSNPTPATAPSLVNTGPGTLLPPLLMAITMGYLIRLKQLAKKQ